MEYQAGIADTEERAASMLLEILCSTLEHWRAKSLAERGVERGRDDKSLGRPGGGR
jgi:hypothetical protein